MTDLPWTPTAFQVEALGKVEWNNQPALEAAS